MCLDLKNNYDLIFSAGGSCATACQLRARGKRHFSLPLDFIFHLSEKTIYALAECFKNDFREWMLFNNLRELAQEERRDGEAYQYEDIFTGYCFVHDFPESKEKIYDQVKERYDRRIKRLYEKIEHAENILVIADVTYHFGEKTFPHLKHSLENRFPGKNFDILVIGYNGESEKKEVKNGINYISTSIDRNWYVFLYPAWEWQFADQISLTSMPPPPPKNPEDLSKAYLIGSGSIWIKSSKRKMLSFNRRMTCLI